MCVARRYRHIVTKGVNRSLLSHHSENKQGPAGGWRAAARSVSVTVTPFRMCRVDGHLTETRSRPVATRTRSLEGDLTCVVFTDVSGHGVARTSIQ
jgi:hypothetical protein